MASFSLVFTAAAAEQLEQLERDSGLAKRLKAVRKTLSSVKEGKVFASYAEQDTPAAFRVFWRYGPGKGQLTIIAITSHP